MSAASDGRERAHVNGKCPACGSSGLFVGSGGYLTCPWAECPNPGAPHDALTFTRAASEREALMAVLMALTHAPPDEHSPADGSCMSCPWPAYMAMRADELADAILAAGFTRQSRAEIQAEDGLDKIADDAATNDGRVIVWAVNELTRAVRGVEAAIREGGE